MEPSETATDGRGTAAATVADTWVRATGHLARGAVEANRAALAAFGLAGGGDADAGAGTETPRRVEPTDGAVAYDLADWTTERTVADRTEIAIGDTVRFSKRLTDEDVRAFARASGDTNRLHLDAAFATESRFGRRIAHGTLVAGLISAALARLPGLTVYLSQDVGFSAPVGVGDRLTAVVEVIEDLGDGRYRLSTDVLDASDEPCVAGEAIVLVDELPDGDGADGD
jgi:acyl dehydratase